MLECLCGSFEFETVYSPEPYGNTLIDYPCGSVCANCGRDSDYAFEVCTGCGQAIDGCECEEAIQ